MLNTAHNQVSPPMHPEHAGASTTHPASPAPHLPDTGSNGLEMRHVRQVVKNEPVSFQGTAPGWIAFTAICLMRLMGKITGSVVDITFLPQSDAA